jgi:ABC-2 type transport system ATP-binding protein
MGYDITKNPVSAQAQMGIVPDISNIYTSLTAWQNLDFTGKLYGIPKTKREKRNKELLERFELFDRKDEKVEGYSRGMRRKICIAMALVNESKILYLDEPTSGLDVKSVRGIRNLIRGLNKEGLTIFLTTHNLDEANKMCDRIAVINRGRIAATGSPENLRGAIERSQSIEISFEKTPNKYENIRDLSEVIDVQKRGDKIRIVTSNPKETLNDLLTFVSNEKCARERVLSAPISLTSVLWGKTMGGVVFGVGVTGFSALLGILLTGQKLINPIAFLCGIILSALVFSTLGIVFASIPSESPGEIIMPLNLVRIPLMFVSGLFIPLNELPGIAVYAALLSPLSHTLDLLRIGMGQESYFGWETNFIILVAWTAIFMIVGRLFHITQMRKT